MTKRKHEPLPVGYPVVVASIVGEYAESWQKDRKDALDQSPANARKWWTGLVDRTETFQEKTEGRALLNSGLSVHQAAEKMGLTYAEFRRLMYGAEEPSPVLRMRVVKRELRLFSGDDAGLDRIIHRMQRLVDEAWEKSENAPQAFRNNAAFKSLRRGLKDGQDILDALSEHANQLDLSDPVERAERLSKIRHLGR